MGMDATVDIFYGYSEELSIDEQEGWEEKLKPFGVYWARSGGYQFLCIEDTLQHFDWNYGPQPLDLKIFTVRPFRLLTLKWNKRLKRACELLGMEWDAKKADWFVVCDYR